MGAELFEAIMLICFGVSWPVSVVKSIKSRSAKGKSLFFLLIIWIGYAVGLIGKIIYNPGVVMIVYICNLVFISMDIALFFINYHRDKLMKAQPSGNK